MLLCGSGRCNDRKFDAQFDAGIFCKYVKVLVTRLLLPFLALFYVLFCYNLLILPNIMSVTSGPLFVNPLPNRVRFFCYARQRTQRTNGINIIFF